MRNLLTFIILIALATGCSDNTEEPVCDQFTGYANVNGVVRDFDGIPLGSAQVEFAMICEGDDMSDYGPIVGRGVSKENGEFDVKLRSGNTEGEQCVVGRVARSDTVSIGKVTFVSDCDPDKPQHSVTLDLVATPAAVIPLDLQIALYRLPPFTSGPHYSVWVDAAGTVTFEGLNNCVVTGVAEGTVELSSVARLYRKFQNVAFWNIKSVHIEDECTQYIFDRHVASTALVAMGSKHSVNHDYGCCGISELESLTDLECSIDEFLETLKWTGSEASPCVLPAGHYCPPSE